MKKRHIFLIFALLILGITIFDIWYYKGSNLFGDFTIYQTIVWFIGRNIFELGLTTVGFFIGWKWSIYKNEV